MIRTGWRGVATVVGCVLTLLVACNAPPESEAPQVLRLATTTSTADSGLLEAILPTFEQQTGARVETVAVGTGQAIALGEKGDADVLLVHARAREEAFVEARHGTVRTDVMFNDFVLVGPMADPAGVQAAPGASSALALIAASGSPFASRGDESGTHTKERELWQTALGVDPSGAWYKSLGQGMGETLVAANELEAYALTDRGTFLAMRANLPTLTILVGGASIAENPDPALRNPYSVIPVNPETHPGVNHTLAQEFVRWLTSLETQAAIGAFGIEEFGQPLFYPAATAQPAP